MTHRAPPALALLLAAGCVVAPPSYEEVARGASPSLADVFLLPPLHGEAPRVQSLSADGQLALVRWRAVQRGTDGRRAWSKDESPYLLRTSAEAHPLRREDGLLAQLERFERLAHARGASHAVASLEGWKPSKPGATAWSQRGSTLAVEWEHALVLLDVGRAAADDAGGRAPYSVLYVDPPKTAKEPLDAGAAPPPSGSALPPWPERLGDVRSLEFSADDSELRVRVADELFTFPLGDRSRRPLALADAQWPTRALEPSLDGLQASRERSAYFSASHALGKLERVAPDGSKRELDAQFLELPSGRLVALEGMKEIASLEGERLAPDGRFVFGAEVDRAHEPPPTLIPDYLTERVTTREGRRDLADEPWPPRKLWMWSTADGARRALELPGETPALVAELGWSPSEVAGAPARFAFRRTSGDYRTVETWVWSEAGLELLLTERDAHWVGGPGTRAQWNFDGTRLLLASECLAASTTPGRNQVFELDPASGALTQVTGVEGEVSSFDELEDGRIVFCASRADPAQRSLGLAERKGDGTWSTRWYRTRPGMNGSPRASAHGELVVYEHGELGRPDELWVSGLDGSCRRLTATVPAEYDALRLRLPLEFSARHADGTEVRSHVYLPRATSLERPDRPRPCVVFIHGAGYLQNVTDSMTEYAVNLMFHSRLASMGYVVADVDYRGSAGYGAEFRGAVQFQLGRLELADIGLIVDALARRGAIDPQRVGCYGGSYGGFLTLMALFTEPERWACGAALRSVTDWRTYHPGYTQPRLGRPSTNAEAYRASSPIDHAAGLQDPLLILHGMLDTNVFAQDSIRLIEKLIDLGKDFEAMLYPSQGHGFEDGAHWLDEYGRIERFLVRHLGAP